MRGAGRMHAGLRVQGACKVQIQLTQPYKFNLTLVHDSTTLDVFTRNAGCFNIVSFETMPARLMFTKISKPFLRLCKIT